MSCNFKYSITYKDNEVTGYVWRCSEQLRGRQLGGKKTCSQAKCKGRKPLLLNPILDVKSPSVQNLINLEHLKWREGSCGNLSCKEEAPLKSKYCSIACKDKFLQTKVQIENNMGRKERNVKVYCALCNEVINRKPWKIKQNKSGLFFCCRAHQEVMMLRYQNNDKSKAFEDRLNGNSKRDK